MCNNNLMMESLQTNLNQQKLSQMKNVYILLRDNLSIDSHCFGICQISINNDFRMNAKNLILI